MASDKIEPPEGFTEGPSNTNDGDVPQIELEPGEVLCGTIVSKYEDEGEYGPFVSLRINDDERGPVDWYAKDEAKTMYFADDISVGDDVWIHHKEETAELSDGGEYHPTVCRRYEE
jgi:hypothetical protein